MSLTPEERRRIYEEEKARLEAHAQVRIEIEAEKAKAKAQEVSLKKKQRRNGWLVLLLIVGIAMYWSSRSPGSNFQTVSFKSGDIAYVKAPFVAIDQASIDAFEDAYHKNDQYGQAELLATGRIFEVPDITKVLVLDRNIANSHIRVLEGKYTGRAGWVRNEWMK